MVTEAFATETVSSSAADRGPFDGNAEAALCERPPFQAIVLFANRAGVGERAQAGPTTGPFDVHEQAVVPCETVGAQLETRGGDE